MNKSIDFRRNVFTFFSVTLALAVSAAAGGCSSEDYTVTPADPAPRTGDEQGPANETASSSSSGAPAVPKSETPAPPAQVEQEAGTDAPVDAAPAICLKKKLSTACVSDGECCSGSCKSELCVPPPGSCTSTTQACSADWQCCSGNCGGGKCVFPAGVCKALDAACNGDEACCSGKCDGAKCINGPLLICKPAGNACNKSLECCSGSCASGTCITSVSTCGDPDAACVAAKDCCSGKCTANKCEAL